MALHTWQISTSPSSLPRWTRPHLAHRKDTNGSQQPWNLQCKQNRIIQWVSEIYNGYYKPLTVPVALALTSYSVSFPLDSSNSKSSVSCCSTFVWLHWLQVHSGKRNIQLHAGYNYLTRIIRSIRITGWFQKFFCDQTALPKALLPENQFVNKKSQQYLTIIQGVPKKSTINNNNERKQFLIHEK